MGHGQWTCLQTQATEAIHLSAHAEIFRHLLTNNPTPSATPHLLLNTDIFAQRASLESYECCWHSCLEMRRGFAGSAVLWLCPKGSSSFLMGRSSSILAERRLQVADSIQVKPHIQLHYSSLQNLLQGCFLNSTWRNSARGWYHRPKTESKLI